MDLSQLIGVGALLLLAFLGWPHIKELLGKLPALTSLLPAKGGDSDPRKAARDKFIEAYDGFHDAGLHYLCSEMEKLAPKALCLHPEHQHEPGGKPS